MKRLLACVSLVAVTTTAAASSTTPAAKPAAKTTAKTNAPKAHPKIRVAPADEYFGKLKMSILGIRNTIKDVGLNLDVDPNRAASLMNKALLTEDAMHDWQKKYPQDTWLPKTVFALERMYAKINSDDGRKRSIATMNWLVRDFPRTEFGKLGKRELAEGRVGHPPSAPLAASEPPATPNAPPAAVVTDGSAPGAADPAPAPPLTAAKPSTSNAR